VANVYRDVIRDDEYVARVLRHKPSALLPLVAQTGAQYRDSWMDSPYRKYTPWALADIARVSLVSGNEFRADATQDDLLQCAAAYVQVNDPELSAGNPDWLTTFLLRITAEQLPHQSNPHNELGRSAALFVQTQPVKAPKVIRPGWDNELFGCDLSQYVGIGFLVHAVAVHNAGRFSTHWFDLPELDPITAVIPADVIRDVVDRHFVASMQWYKRFRPPRKSDGYRRFTFNPLLARPVVSGVVDEQIVPVVGQVFRKVSPIGIYYAGAEHWGNSFTEDVGDLFEQYIGRQLQQIPDGTVYPEIVYDRDGAKRSVDWIVVCADIVLLIEVKSAPPTEAVRLGTPAAMDDLKKKLGRAYEQLNNTDDLIAKAHPDFAHIPDNLPRRGLIVTLESFAIANAKPITDLHIKPNIPTSVCSSLDIELLVTLQGQSVGEFFDEFMADPAMAGANLYAGLMKKDIARNDVLDQAWTLFDWGTNSNEVAPH
jgi:hypothetical protein